MPRHTRRAGNRAGNVLAVENDAAGRRPEKSGDQVEERCLAGAVGADHGAQFARLDIHRHVADGDQAAEMLGDILDLQQTHVITFRRMMPSTPRGKNSTTRTKKRPMNDIQFSVWLEI